MRMIIIGQEREDVADNIWEGKESKGMFQFQNHTYIHTYNTPHFSFFPLHTVFIFPPSQGRDFVGFLPIGSRRWDPSNQLTETES